MTTAEYYEDYKARKNSARAQILSHHKHNAPHPLTSIGYTGSASLVVATPQSSPFTSATRYEYDFDFTLIPALARMAIEFLSIHSDANILSHLADDEFYLTHFADEPWNFSGSSVSSTAEIGTCRKIEYALVSGTWNTTSDNTYLVSANADVIISGGGDAVSGGRNVEDDTEKTSIRVYLDYWHLTGSPAVYTLPSSYGAGHLAKRFPWDSTWTAEADVLKVQWDTWVATFNPAHIVSQAYSLGASFS